MNPVDVLVVGLGPAGGAAAAAAAAGGLSVMGIDRREQIGLPVQCAEFIPLPLGSYAQDDGVILQAVSGMKSYLPSGAVEQSAFPGWMIDRAKFDQALATQAQRNGARLHTSARLVAIDSAQRTARIYLDGAEHRIGYRMLVAADGPHSQVATSLGWPALQVVYTRQYTVELKQRYADTDIWLSGDYPGGYAWLFPKGGLANIGLGIDKSHAPDLKQPLDALHRQLVRQGLVGETILSRTGGAIPVGGMRERLMAGEGIVFVGDAAGLTHPITGGGIPAAVLSGVRAGEAAVDWLVGGRTDALEDYEQDMRDQYEATLQRAVARRQWLAQFWNTDAARDDAVHRRGWIAFPEYFEQ
ncbi:MAG: NAD(P)/FAD-dependent oxidoreductase [Betaproteobacteria bacterium]|nr:NAD(P)/FAD-dependent oxidoreductase [Betaproteobacteria bacterium]